MTKVKDIFFFSYIPYRKNFKDNFQVECQFFLFSYRPELVFDKNGIRVSSDPPGDEHGVIELKVESGKYGQIMLIIENLSEETITLKDITLLWSVNFFDYSEISSIGPYEGQLYPGNSWLTPYNPF